MQQPSSLQGPTCARARLGTHLGARSVWTSTTAAATLASSSVSICLVSIGYRLVKSPFWHVSNNVIMGFLPIKYVIHDTKYWLISQIVKHQREFQQFTPNWLSDNIAEIIAFLQSKSIPKIPVLSILKAGVEISALETGITG